MSKTDCKRCNNEGTIGRYAHVAGGRCFACGRCASQDGREMPTDPGRADVIRRIAALLAQAKSTPEHFAPMPDGCGGTETAPQFNSAQGLVMCAPADVKKRALAAFAQLGIRL